MENEESKLKLHPSLERLNFLSEILDNKFRIPGTNTRFGVDGIVGIIPYAGDIFTFIVSGYLLYLMIRKGAGGKLVFKMIWNIWIDGAFGTVPLIGDIFDFRHRANIKNVNLMQEFILSDKHKGSAWPIVILLVLILFALIVLSIWTIRWAFMYLIALV